MRILRAAADPGPDVVGRVAGQVVPVERRGARGQVSEAEQHARDRGLSRAVGADQRDPPPGRQVEIEPVEGGPATGLIADLGPAQRHPDRAVGYLPRPGGLADRGRRVQDHRDPAGRHPGLPELDRCGGQHGDRLEGGERGQRQHGQRDPGQRAVPGGRDPEQQDAPQGQPGDRGAQARAEA